MVSWILGVFFILVLGLVGYMCLFAYFFHELRKKNGSSFYTRMGLRQLIAEYIKMKKGEKR